MTTKLPDSNSPYPQSPAGTYIDAQGYKHICFWDNSYKRYVIILKNPQGKHCSSARYSRQEAWNQVIGLQKVH